MAILVNQPFSRRGVLRLGVATAAMLAAPWPRARRRADAAVRVPTHFVVTFFADGGWDPTQVLDPHNPNDMTDGIDVDVPGEPISTLASASGLTYVSNPMRRPAVDAFFSRWGARSAIINGINTRSTSHDQSKQLVLTGALDGTRADFAVIAANHIGPDLPLPHLLVSGPSYGGQFSGLSGRLGGQMSRAIDWRRSADNKTFVLSDAGEVFVDETLDAEAALAAAETNTAVGGRFAAAHDANGRATRMAELAGSLDIDRGDGLRFAQSLGEAFRAGLACSVTAGISGGFDTHNDNRQQHTRWNDVFVFLKAFVDGLAAETGVAAASLLDETTIVMCSEFGRTPELNGDNGKDHHPWTSMLVVGKHVRGGTVVGATDGNQEGLKIDLATGQPDSNGQILDVVNVVAGMVTLVGGNPADYMPSVQACTGFVA